MRKCDEKLAQDAITLANVVQYQFYTTSIIKKITKQKIHDIWQNLWDKIDTKLNEIKSCVSFWPNNSTIRR